MPILQAFSLPLPLNGPPEGFEFQEHSVSRRSTTTAFETSLYERDQSYCVICGTCVVERCHIIAKTESETWWILKENGYIPRSAKSVEHEPRNGLHMCPTHRAYFDQYYFFIRFSPINRKFIMVNHSHVKHGWLEDYHGRAIALDPDHPYAPFPGLFLIHEQRVRGFRPFSPSPNIPEEILPPRWGPIAKKSDLFVGGEQSQHLTPSGNVSSDPALDNMRELTIDDATIQEILQASWNSESWKACVQENNSWDGTTEENISKYLQQTSI